jgi:hypothetical protein
MGSCAQQRKRLGPLKRDQVKVVVTVTDWIMALTNNR